MELRHLTAFATVAELRHFGRAAQRLGITQPPLSRQIQQLEADLGVKLFTRHSRSVDLTPEGTAYLAAVKPHLEGLHRARYVAKTTQSQKRGKLRVGIVSSLAYGLMPRLLHALRSEAREIEVELFEHPSDEQCRAVCDRRLDLGLVYLPVGAQELKMRFLFREPLVLMLPRKHRFSRLSEVPLDHLHDEPFIMCSRQPQSGFHETVLALCRANGFEPRVAHSAASMATMVELVASGLGLALVPQSASNQNHAGALFRPLAKSPLMLEVAAVWCSAAMTPLLRLFLDRAVKVSRTCDPARFQNIQPAAIKESVRVLDEKPQALMR